MLRKFFPMKLHATAVALAFTITMLAGTIYLVSQQMIRGAANDPQIQMADETVQRLQAGASATSLISGDQADMEKTLSPYLIIYNEDRTPLAAGVTLKGAIPKPPVGVFEYTKNQGQDRLTWQPQEGVRSALVMRYFSAADQSGYVLAGRSLTEAEKQESQITLLVSIGWFLSLVGSMLVFWLAERRTLTIE
jgi:hypothetical protein